MAAGDITPFGSVYQHIVGYNWYHGGVQLDSNHFLDICGAGCEVLEFDQSTGQITDYPMCSGWAAGSDIKGQRAFVLDSTHILLAWIEQTTRFPWAVVLELDRSTWTLTVLSSGKCQIGGNVITSVGLEIVDTGDNEHFLCFYGTNTGNVSIFSVDKSTWIINLYNSINYDTGYCWAVSACKLSSTKYPFFRVHENEPNCGAARVLTANPPTTITLSFQQNDLYFNSGGRVYTTGSAYIIDSSHVILFFMDGLTGRIRAYTFSIDSSDIMSVIQTYEFPYDTNVPEHPSVCRIDNYTYIIGQRVAGYNCYLRTVTVTPGTYTISELGSSYIVDSNNMDVTNTLLYMGNNKIAVAWTRGGIGQGVYSQILQIELPEGFVNINTIMGVSGVNINSVLGIPVASINSIMGVS